MVDLVKIIESLQLEVLTENKLPEQIEIKNGYTSDLLSCVMAGAPNQSIWVTLQSHINIVAVAALLDLSAIIITEGSKPEQSTIAKANEEGVHLLLTEKNSFYVVGKLWEMGLRAD